MVEYKKIKVVSADNPKRLYRIIAVKNDISLIKLGYVIGASFRAWFEHGYCFDDGEITYVPVPWIDYGFNDDYVPMKNYRLPDLGSEFIYEYDTGEGYNFKCSVLKKPYKYEYDDGPEAMVIEGKGQGIFENNHGCLDDYLRGLIDPNSDEENEEKGWYLPMNMSFEKYGDFDEPLDLDEFEYYEEELEEEEAMLIKREKQQIGEERYNELVSEMPFFVNPNHNDVINFYDDDEDDFDDEDFEEMMGSTIGRAFVALTIFENDIINREFLKLLGEYSMREAFEICYDILSEMPEDLDDDECGRRLADILDND